MADGIVTITERKVTTTVDNIEHIESRSLYGIAVVKVFLQLSVRLQQGVARITAVSQTRLRQLPAGPPPPLIIAYRTTSAPVLQLALSGQHRSELCVKCEGSVFGHFCQQESIWGQGHPTRRGATCGEMRDQSAWSQKCSARQELIFTGTRPQTSPSSRFRPWVGWQSSSLWE
jgi:hypothetical protein